MPSALARLLSALQFLTRLPVPDPGWEEGRLRAALPFFPVAGAAVGLIGAGVWWASGAVLPGAVAAGLALAAMLLATGGMHEDGLGDVADGLGGGASAERALEIMRDSRIGSYAALAIGLSVGLRWAALAPVAPADGAVALVIAATVARAVMVPASALVTPARPDGLGRMLGQGADAPGMALALGLGLVVAAAGGMAGIGALLAALAAMALVVRLMARRVGGMTGDGYGAIASLAETAAMLVLCAAWVGA
ncbi:adenosylcobinamide-GDP ribazoletransferase [Limibaculum sp. FT325]|uniref:adenosylcobinamide-GDP ribazoletransferase n=1 Tax=Thermohalobaculum sediminis TaxID=2939436 RepID=UPI0020C00B72|nr:adenosylcobinamide-GDP ribazoletransferase [Limibaculum sediminis]MCL5775448.1 adenosylcobinamide-GDP ribazoletransferase [Limibaculum sediminis]